MGLAISVAMPFAVLGAIEAAGATITELAILGGISAEALASVGAGAVIGAGMVGATALVHNDLKAQEEEIMPISTTTNVLAVQRPISAWRSWVNLSP